MMKVPPYLNRKSTLNVSKATNSQTARLCRFTKINPFHPVMSVAIQSRSLPKISKSSVYDFDDRLRQLLISHDMYRNSG